MVFTYHEGLLGSALFQATHNLCEDQCRSTSIVILVNSRTEEHLVVLYVFILLYIRSYVESAPGDDHLDYYETVKALYYPPYCIPILPVSNLLLSCK